MEMVFSLLQEIYGPILQHLSEFHFRKEFYEVLIPKLSVVLGNVQGLNDRMALKLTTDEKVTCVY